MRIERIETLLMQAQPPGVTAWAGSSALASSRNWLFVEVTTDTGITDIGEGSGGPRVVATAVNDLAHVLLLAA